MKYIKYLFLTLVLILGTQGAWAASMTVYSTGTDEENGVALQAAWAQLVDGDVLTIEAGNFTLSGNLSTSAVLKNTNAVSIVGAGMESTIINAAGYYILVIQAKYNMSGFKMYGGVEGIYAYGAAGYSSGRDYIDAYYSIVNLDGVWIDGSTVYGGVFYFNYAYAESIVNSKFTNNTSTGVDGAIYITDLQADLTLENNLIYNNAGGEAVSINTTGTPVLTMRNNTIANNVNGGLVTSGAFSSDFDNNIITDNGTDVSGEDLSGDYNVVENSSVTFSGSNNTTGVSGVYFTPGSDPLFHTDLGVEYTLFKLTSNFPNNDVYGTSRNNPSDIGAFEVPLDDQGIAYWAGGASDHSWTNTTNWRRGVAPDYSFTKVNILPSTVSNYPHINDGSTVNISSATLDISSSSIFYNEGSLLVNSIRVNSDANGTGQFLNDGTMNPTGLQFYEQYLSSGKWHFLGNTNEASTPADLFSGDIASSVSDPTADYWLSCYDAQARASTGMGTAWDDITSVSTSLSINKGIIVWVDVPQTVEFASTPQGEVDVALAYNTGVKSSNEWGWDFISNPFSITFSSDKVLASNTSDATSRTIYIKGDNDEYETRTAGGQGSAEFIPAHQAFFVQSLSGGAVLQMKPSDAEFTTGINFKSTSLAQRNVLIVSVGDTEVRDEAYFRQQEGCTDDYDNGWDSYKLTSRSVTHLGIRSVLNEIDYDVNSFSIDEGSVKTIPLFITVPDDLEEMTFSFDVEGFEGHEIYLRDHRNGTLTEVKHDMQYLVTLDDNQSAITLNDQFSLEIRSLDVVTGECCDVLTKEKVKVYTTSNGLRVFSENKSEAIDIVVYDLQGKTVAHQTLVGGDGSISSLNKGVYIVKVQQSEVIENHKVIVP